MHYIKQRKPCCLSCKIVSASLVIGYKLVSCAVDMLAHLLHIYGQHLGRLADVVF